MRWNIYFDTYTIANPSSQDQYQTYDMRTAYHVTKILLLIDEITTEKSSKQLEVVIKQQVSEGYILCA